MKREKDPKPAEPVFKAFLISQNPFFMASRICCWLFERSHDLLSRCEGVYLGPDQPKTAALSFSSKLVTVTQAYSSQLQKPHINMWYNNNNTGGDKVNQNIRRNLEKRRGRGGAEGSEGKPAQIGLFVSSTQH